jgi:hypothetical protein
MFVAFMLFVKDSLYFGGMGSNSVACPIKFFKKNSSLMTDNFWKIQQIKK